MIAQFSAEFHNLAIYGAICRRVIRPLNRLDELFTAVRYSRMARQKSQQAKLGLRQWNRASRNKGFASLRAKN